MSNTIITNSVIAELSSRLQHIAYDRLFLLTDNDTKKYCLPLISKMPELAKAQLITIPSGDEHKNLQSLVSIWEYLSNNQATRKSLLVNLGGGLISDIGGFAASTFKRGMRYINIPTTLLAIVDAATGGKTGINFNGLKNEIGIINSAECVIIDPIFLQTLSRENILSGFAEMMKHALISSSQNWDDILNFDLDNIDLVKLSKLLDNSLRVKEEFERQDPHEQGIRKALNFGHTIGHAFESLACEQEHPVLHGYAVAWGLLCETYMSLSCGFPKEQLLQLRQIIKDFYGFYIINCKDYERLYHFMTHDKKNEATNINFTLLAGIGEVRLNHTASKEDIFEALDFYREVAP